MISRDESGKRTGTWYNYRRPKCGRLSLLEPTSVSAVDSCRSVDQVSHITVIPQLIAKISGRP